MRKHFALLFYQLQEEILEKYFGVILLTILCTLYRFRVTEKMCTVIKWSILQNEGLKYIVFLRINYKNKT
jgi:hypothetical protein